MKKLSHLFSRKPFNYFTYKSVISLAIAILIGYQIGYWDFNAKPLPHIPSQNPLTEAQVSYQYEQQLHMLARHIGRIEANLMRINALGERLVESAQLDPGEFNFKQEVGLGGLFSAEMTPDDLLFNLKGLDALLDKRYIQLTALHQALHTHFGQQERSFSNSNGKLAVVNGWISSFFGSRYDPFTGRKAWHAGVDIAGKEGAEIKALAGGIVSFANIKGNYGRTVEINHGNGLITRYAHSKALLVTPGQLVRKGETIALLGSSGRSTGPHLHLEVHQNGTAVDPGLHFPDLRRS